jgi:hypothetical protein
MVGTALMRLCPLRTAAHSRTLGRAAVFALVVDAIDEAAARFYRHHGFEAFSGRAARLFLTVATAARMVDG